MRITGGRARGIRVRVSARGVRPATDRMREAVFSSLAGCFAGGRFLDLFAGSGAYGLEAWSRGAACGDFVENHGRVASLLTENIRDVARSLDLEASVCRVWRSDVLRWEPEHPGLYSLVFADPPYAEGERLVPEIFRRVGRWAACAETTRLVLELPGAIEPAIPEGWRVVRSLGKGIGDPSVRILLRVPHCQSAAHG